MSLIRKWLSGVSFSCLGVQAQACMIDFCPTFFSSHWVNLWLHSLSHGSWCCGGEGGNSSMCSGRVGHGGLQNSLKAASMMPFAAIMRPTPHGRVEPDRQALLKCQHVGFQRGYIGFQRGHRFSAQQRRFSSRLHRFSAQQRRFSSPCPSWRCRTWRPRLPPSSNPASRSVLTALCVSNRDHGVHSAARGVGQGPPSLIGSRAPARGPGPLAPSLRAGHPMKGEYPLQNPRSHPTLFSRYWMRRWRHSGLHCPWCYGGEGGIRTHGPLPVNGFRDRPIRPLSHLSAHQDSSAKPAAQSRAVSIIQIRKRDRHCFRNVYRLTFVLKRLSKIWPFR